METDQHTDHRAEALRLLEQAATVELGAYEQFLVGQAQVHASLAIAQGQERVAEELKSIGDLLYRNIEGRASRG